MGESCYRLEDIGRIVFLTHEEAVNKLEEMKKMTIGKRIREVRLQNDMSLRDFAELIEVTDTAVMEWEKGISNIPFVCAIEIADRFDVKLNWLAGLED